MKRIKIKFITGIAVALAAFMVMYACNKDFLEKAPLGALDPAFLANKQVP